MQHSEKFDAFIGKLNGVIEARKGSHFAAALHTVHVMVERDRRVIFGDEPDVSARLLSTLSTLLAVCVAGIEYLRTEGGQDAADLEGLVFELLDLLASSKRA